MAAPLFSVESWATQFFGYSKFSRKRYKSGYHNGLDIKPIDEQSWGIFSPSIFRIMETGENESYGKFIKAWNRWNGFLMVFWHLESIAVAENDILQVGDLLGVGGNTGKNTTGRHLHAGYMPMRVYGKADFPGNGTAGWVDPIGALREMGVNI